MRPNLFSIATKELSQDGFFTWLLQWSSPECADEDRELYGCACEFVKLMIGEDVTVSTIRTQRQLKHVDVSAAVNDKYFLIIEDKTYTGEHGNQLERYKDEVQNYCGEHNLTLKCVFVKTGDMSIKDTRLVESKGYNVFGRKDLLAFFEKYEDVKSEIFRDYIGHLMSLEYDRNSYKRLPIKDWYWESWAGFYTVIDMELQKMGLDNNWKFVNNPCNSFWGLYWSFKEIDGYYVYLQLEEKELCFKVCEVSEDRSEIRNKWYCRIMDAAKKKGLPVFRPQRFGSGNSMTIAEVRVEDWLGDTDRMVDIDFVLSSIKKYTEFFNECVK